MEGQGGAGPGVYDNRGNYILSEGGTKSHPRNMLSERTKRARRANTEDCLQSEDPVQSVAMNSRSGAIGAQAQPRQKAPQGPRSVWLWIVNDHPMHFFDCYVEALLRTGRRSTSSFPMDGITTSTRPAIQQGLSTNHAVFDQRLNGAV